MGEVLDTNIPEYTNQKTLDRKNKNYLAKNRGR